MSPLKQSNNIAARMGRWSASHWKTAVFGWLAFVIVAVVARHRRRARRTSTSNDTNVGQSKRADHILRDAGFQADPQTEIVSSRATSYRATTRPSARPSTTPSRR